jgi:hypothetical protein
MLQLQLLLLSPFALQCYMLPPVSAEATTQGQAAASSSLAAAAAMLEAGPSWQTEFTRSKTWSDIKQSCSISSSDSLFTALFRAPLRALFSSDKFAMAFLAASDRLVAKLLGAAFLSKFGLFISGKCRKQERGVVRGVVRGVERGVGSFMLWKLPRGVVFCGMNGFADCATALQSISGFLPLLTADTAESAVSRV